MRLGFETSFFEILEFSSCLLISCFYICSRTSLCSLLVSCLDMCAWRLLCNLIDDTKNDTLVSTKTINEESRENLKISKKWVPVLRPSFCKISKVFSYLFISCFCFSSRTSLCSLFVCCNDMYAWRLLCSLLDVFVVYSKISMKKL
jgi:hypothetical protein